MIKILVAQPASVASKYDNLMEKYPVSITFTKFFNIEPVSVRDFRGQNINIPDYSAIVFSSKATIDAFFGICKQVKVKMPDDQKYFCTTEDVALYLQKHIVYRKRKIFFGDGSFRSVVRIASLEKHKRERFLIVTPDKQNGDLIRLFSEAGLSFSTSIMARKVGADLKYLDLKDYQIICCYNVEDVNSLLANFPGFKQEKIKFIAFGAGARKAMKENGLKTFIEGPTSELPSLNSALEAVLKNPDYKQTVLPPALVEPKPAVQPVVKAEVKPVEKPEVKPAEKPAAKTAEKPAAKKQELKPAPKKTVAAKPEDKKQEAKKPAAKPVTKKQEAKKPAAKPVVKKAAAKKPAVKKPIAKKIAKSAMKKAVAKKPAVKKPIAKKPIVKKAAPKKPVAKKPIVKKAVAKKIAVKKAVVKKSAPKKAVIKKAAPKKPAIKKVTVKKTAVKKAASKKPSGKKVVAKKPIVKKAAPKKQIAKKIVKKIAAKKIVKKSAKKK